LVHKRYGMELEIIDTLLNDAGYHIYFKINGIPFRLTTTVSKKKQLVAKEYTEETRQIIENMNGQLEELFGVLFELVTIDSK